MTESNNKICCCNLPYGRGTLRLLAQVAKQHIQRYSSTLFYNFRENFDFTATGASWIRFCQASLLPFDALSIP